MAVPREIDEISASLARSERLLDQLEAGLKSADRRRQAAVCRLMDQADRHHDELMAVVQRGFR